MSLLVTGATLVTRLAPLELRRADLLLRGGRIERIQPEPEMAVGASVLDAEGCVVIPGNENAHMHAYSALARGMPYRLAPPTSFLEILQRVWWRLDRALDQESIRASALVAAREALLSGTTTLIDHHASPNAIDGSLHVLAEAFGELGLRSVLAYEVTDRDGPERANAGVEENRRFLRRVAEGWYPLARGMVGAHASFTLSDATLLACAELSREERSGLHIHVAEDALDEADAVARGNRRVIHRLAAVGALDRRSLLAHAVHVDPSEAELVRAAHATVAHNPRSNMHNGVGRTPLAWLGERVALGTDGIGSDLFEESRVGFLRRREEDLATDAGWPLARLAASARVAGDAFGEEALGRVAPGAPADLVVLDAGFPTPIQPSTFAGHWVFGLSSRSVRDVIVAGQVVVRERRLTRVDETELAAHAREQAARLWARLEEIPAHPFVPARLLATAGR
jgi:putative selenium metabolism protein SsnA